MKTVAAVLGRAARRIAGNAWVQGAGRVIWDQYWADTSGNFGRTIIATFCAGQAIAFDTERTLAVEAEKLVQEITGKNIVAFNDAPGRQQHEVVAVLARAAVRASRMQP